MGNIKAQTLKGFRDFLPEKAKKRAWLMDTLKKVFESYGFEPLETPTLEYEEVLLGKYGDEGDKLMYRFEDNGKRKVALRYDQTVPLARVVAQYQNELPMPFKRYQIQNVWRAENTQKGRYREFIQCDVDTVGTSSPLSDAEIIAVAYDCLKKLGLNPIIKINDRDLLKEIPMKALPTLDKLNKIGEKEVLKELETKGFSSGEAKKLLEQAKAFKASVYLREVIAEFERMGYLSNSLKFDGTLIRGLDYYTGLIFEIEIEGYDAGSVAGGGRYDNLIGMFAGRDIPAVGFAFGFDRLMEALEQFDLFPKELSSVKALITISDSKDKSLEIYKKLRDENISCEVYLEKNAKLEKQLKYADKKQIPYSIIVEENSIILKDMKKREQEEININDLFNKLS